MLTWRYLSVPARIVTILIAFVVIGSTVYLVNRFVYGKITISVSVSAASIERQDDEVIYPAPHTFTLKPGRYIFFVSAPGYVRTKSRLTVFPFWSRKVTVKPMKDVSFENDHFRLEYNEQNQTFLIVPKISLTGQDAPQNQVAAQWDAYKQYAKEALAYIRSQGVNPNKIKIEWWAREWWPKGQAITP